MQNIKLTKFLSITLFLVLLFANNNFVYADEFTLLGHGVCRAAINTDKKIYSYKDYSWQKCRELCVSRKCSGIEYNIQDDRSICEHHYVPVKLKPTNPKDRVHSCWARIEVSPNSGSFAPLPHSQELNCTKLNSITAVCDCDHEPTAKHAAACKIVLDANCSYHPADNVWTCPIDPK